MEKIFVYLVEKVYIPKALLRKIYVKGSMQAIENGLVFKLKNILASATIDAPIRVFVDGVEVEPENIELEIDGKKLKASEISAENPLNFPLGKELIVIVKGSYDKGKHKVVLEASIKGYGRGKIEIEDEAQ